MRLKMTAKARQSRSPHEYVEKGVLTRLPLPLGWTRWRRRTIAAVCFAAILFLSVLLSPFTSSALEVYDKVMGICNHEDWNERRDAVKEVFIESWDAYAEHAWGKDRFHPMSKSGSQMSPKGLGWIIVDSLDTLMLMNLTTRLADARRWVSRNLDYEQTQDVNTFETTIRMLGGLLSAHYLSQELSGSSSSRDHVYLAKATNLANRLLGAFASKSGVPFASIDLQSGTGIPSHADMGASSTAEATTLQIEMKYLSNLTGNDVYWRTAEKVIKVVDGQSPKAGLVPIFIDVHSGTFTTKEIRLGSRGDSYYGVFNFAFYSNLERETSADLYLIEYLIKQYLHTSEQEPIYRDMWQEALSGIERYLLISTKKARLNMIAELPQGIGGPLSPKMDHLVCFLPGAIALGATNGLAESEARRLPSWTAQKEREMHLARELMKSCWAMYAVTATGLAPEIVWFHADAQVSPGRIWRSGNRVSDWKEDFVIKPLDAHNLQRPETVESLFVMWRITGEAKYRRWGWEIFQAFQRHSALRNFGSGYTSLENVNQVPPPQRDNMESFWLAETLKYLYLLFSPNDFMPLTRVVFNTEAHILPKIELGKFRTGWSRRKG